VNQIAARSDGKIVAVACWDGLVSFILSCVSFILSHSLMRWCMGHECARRNMCVCGKRKWLPERKDLATPALLICTLPRSRLTT
jgi:hypothetical protein